jgi:cyclophilin family peptidyl-prolyl cis-trans isomerase
VFEEVFDAMKHGRRVSLLLPGLAAVVALGLSLTMGSAAAGAGPNPIVVIDTSAGPITVELDPEKAPITVANFLKYVDDGFYDNLIFHRVMPGFMIQGGGFDAPMRSEKPTRAPIKNEATNGLNNRRGTIAMARRPDADSATAQFFINLVDNSSKLDPGGVSPDGYAVFGKVIAGMENVDAIAKVPTGSRGPHQNVPVEAIVIKSVRRKAKS